MKNIFLFLFFVFLMGTALPSLAAGVKPPTIPCPGNVPCITDQDPTKVREHVTQTFAIKFLRTFLGMAAITAVIFIIVGGVQMHLALGNEEELGKAKKTLLWAIVGLVIAILSVAIVQIVSTIL